VLFARAGGAVPLKVDLALAPGAAGQGDRASVAIVSQNPTGRVEHRGEVAALPGAASFNVPAGSAWSIEVDAPGLWAARRVVEVGQESAAQRIMLLPGGTLIGELRIPTGRPETRAVTVRFRPARGAALKLGETTSSCPVVGRRFRCAVPAGDLDVRLRVPGYLSHYRWGAHVTRDALSVGLLDLKPGSSIVGWIEVPPADRQFRFADCTVEVEPQTVAPSFARQDVERKGSLALSAQVNDRGFFAITGVPPGAYVLIAHHPRYAPSRIAPVAVLAGGESEVKDIELKPPLAFEVRVDPPLDPYQKPWTVRLSKIGGQPGYAVQVAEGAVATDGGWRKTGLEPGAYVLSIDGSFRSSWYHEEIELSAASPVREVHLPIVHADGVVSLGTKPVPAVLWFGGAHGAVKIPAKSDEKGKFEVSLPAAPETWSADIGNGRLHLYAHLDGIDARPAPGASTAHLRLELPDTAIRGVVVDEAGTPLPDIPVQAVPDQGDARTVHSTAPDGRFEILALKPQGWRLEASSDDGGGGMASESVRVQLGADQAAEGIRLMMRRRVKLSGLVVSPEGQGIPGANVIANLEQADVFLSSTIPETFTDVAGQFELRLPAGAHGVQLTVLPPGFAITQVRVEAGRPEPLVIPVSPIGGTIVLSYARDPSQPAALQRVSTTLFHDFRVGLPSALLEWATANGADESDPGTFVIPMVEPGQYTACFDAWLPTFASGRLTASVTRQCASGALAPFGELRLRLPAPEKPAEGTRATDPAGR
jgi:hypothetical protein